MAALELHHIDAEASRIAKLRDGLLVIPACGSRFADFPRRDMRPLDALACLAAVIIVGSAGVAILRFVAVL
ncbi:hypothetical protein [Methylobacterium indicum]|uniref:Uncharacterized protein n=1 Tax=Methylobacterium indicum TaxID=1775910 RepID=A0ABR5HER5_9HYPH|nr:hypothetical protein [Methylobacterium indicum]KMO18880.1 hypothetical protein QR78_14270 [Methylobacterium indicum]KMO25038.1 hypothetical protein QR79_09660 [Methylobacterium indicum]